MGYYVVFGLLGAGIGGGLTILLYATTSWHPYLAWLAAWSVAAFVIYGLDKGLAKANGPRVPELILNLLALVGGFAGGWLGMAVFHHKSNYRRHPGMWAVLALSTLGHLVLIYFWLIRG
jgi:uncharacterized membrane protein YsdA (DUF1294 family)